MESHFDVGTCVHLRPGHCAGGGRRQVEADHPVPSRRRVRAASASCRKLVQGISEKVLIQQLRELEADGVVSRHDHQEVPPRVDYTMTPFGQTLAAALVPLCAWGDEHRSRIEEIHLRREMLRAA